MNERFLFLKSITKASNVRISEEQLSFLWREMVTLSMFPSDNDQFFKFLKEICELHTEGYCIIDMDELVKFFKEQILDNGGDFLPKITTEGFYAI
jgi:hypothetical protein